MTDQKDPSDDPKTKKPRPINKVVELPRTFEVSEKHGADLKRSGLTDESVKLAELYTEIHNNKIAALLDKPSWPRNAGAALVFPFYLPNELKPHAYRIRPTQPRIVGKRRDGTPKYAKYDQGTSAGVLVYYPPRARAAKAYGDVTQTLYWTEGEKKALVLDQLGLTTIGLTGVWNWIDVEHQRETHGERLHERIREHVTIAGRHHVICYDADSRTNDQVMLAAGRLAGVLQIAGAASIKFVCPLSKEHKGIDDYYAAFGESPTRQLLATAETIEPVSPKEQYQKLRNIKALRDAPIEGDQRLPPGYEIDAEGALWKLAGDEKHGDVKIARAPILIQRYLDDHYTGEGRIDVCFERDGRWQTACVSRKAVVDSRAMVDGLSPYGAPCTSNNAGKLVDWLDDLERVNVGKIPRVACVARAGWHDIDGRRVFVLDEPLTPASEDRVDLALDTRGDRKKLFSALRSVACDKPEAEREHLEREHLAALLRAWAADDVAAALIAGALAAPLLEILQAPNFGIHLPGDSSRGKTSMLKIAGSVFGDPNSEQWISNWNITHVGAELRAATLNHLPQLYDEAGASDAESVEQKIYMLINGGGRARGQRDLQLRETPSWRTIVLSTGERGIADENAATGAQIRIIHLPVTRFGELGAEGVDELRESCIAHAGVFGRQWIELLLDADDWKAIQQRYKAYLAILRQKAANDPLKGRLASYFAVLCVAESLASSLGLGDPNAATMQRLFADGSARREEVKSLADRSLDMAIAWISSQPDAFPSLKIATSGQLEPERKTGARVLHGFRDKGQVLFITEQFREWCADKRLPPREVLRGWKERGWLDAEPNRMDKQKRIGDTKTRFYVLSAHALDDELLDFTPHPAEAALSESDGDEVSI